MSQTVSDFTRMVWDLHTTVGLIMEQSGTLYEIARRDPDRADHEAIVSTVFTILDIFDVLPIEKIASENNMPQLADCWNTIKRDLDYLVTRQIETNAELLVREYIKDAQEAV